ncbi:MAG: ABC-three component system protein [Clostridium sp.]|uniref:ABC-three component system protein n=1 Tax=Clostridium sp. TaxID=1506 RepID=UPI003F2C336A
MSINKFVYMLSFKSILQDSSGNEFEKYVYKVLSMKYPNFEKVDVQGKVGDRKNDGYRVGEGIFYQVYGPKDSNATNSEIQKYAEKKLVDDFLDLKNHIDNGYWEEIREYIFVFNNINGLFPDLHEKIKTLRLDYPNIAFRTMDRDALISEFNYLTETDMQIIVQNFLPNLDNALIDNLILKDIVNYLIKNNSNKCCSKLIAPDFNEKLKFNQLSIYNCNRLTMGNYNVENLNNFLDSYSIEISQELCQIYSELYKKSKTLYLNDSDQQLEYLIDNSFDKSILDPVSIMLYEANTLVILSKYFETCDIFEEPEESAC